MKFKKNILKCLNLRFLLPVIFSYLVCSNDFGLVPTIPSPVILAAAIICILDILFHSKCKIQLPCLIFLLYLPINLLITMPDAVFRSWERFIFYASYFILATFLLQSKRARNIRELSFKFCIFFSILIGVLSFFAYFMGFSAMYIERMDDNMNIDAYSTGYFSGVAKHSMSLGPLAGLGTIASAYLGIQKNKVYYIFAILCMGSVLFSASRIALVSAIGGLLFVLYTFTRSKTKFIKYLFSLLIIGALSFPLWKSSLRGVWEKQINQESLLGSRNEKFNYRFEEFLSSPLWGVGFCSISTEGKDIVTETGIIEPGSSWLAILSMTGLIGFILFLNIYIISFKQILRYRGPTKILLISCLVLLSIHMFAEGYIFAAGNPLSYFFLIIIGCGYDLKYKLKLNLF